MTEIYKIISYIAVSFVLNLAGQHLQSDFIDSFCNDFIINLLTTILAINIASSSLIANQLKDISARTGQTFTQTTSELKRSLVIQIVLIGIAFVSLFFKKSLVIETAITKPTLILICNTITLSIFIYFLDIIYDLGKALFSFIDVKKDK